MALGIYRTYHQFLIEPATLIDFEIYYGMEMLRQASSKMSLVGWYKGIEYVGWGNSKSGPAARVNRMWLKYCRVIKVRVLIQPHPSRSCHTRFAHATPLMSFS
jgi:hypothetical protein